jgi:hypothetical protein
MTDTYGYDFDSIDDEVLLAGKDGWASGGGGGDSFWNFPTKKDPGPKTFYFLRDFWTAKEDHAWWNWRECFAREGLAGGIALDGGLKGIPVRDIRLNADGLRLNIPEGDPEYDQLLGMVVPYSDAKFGRNKPERPVSDKVGVNILEVGPNGELWHKVMVLSGARGAKVKRQLLSWREMVDGFSVIGRQFVLGFSGSGATELVTLNVVKDAPPPGDAPDIIDIPASLQERRNAIFELVENWTGVATEAFAQADAAVTAEATAVGEEVGFDPMFSTAAAPETGPGFTQPVMADITPPGADYSTMTDARIKTLLTKKGVTVPPKTPRGKLIELAQEHSA